MRTSLMPRALDNLWDEVAHELGWLDERASTGAGPMRQNGLPRPQIDSYLAGTSNCETMEVIARSAGKSAWPDIGNLSPA